VTPLNHPFCFGREAKWPQLLLDEKAITYV